MISPRAWVLIAALLAVVQLGGCAGFLDSYELRPGGASRESPY